MKIEIEVENIKYDELVKIFLPEIKELGDNPIVQAVAYVPPELAEKVIKHIPQSALDSLVESIVNKKKYEIMKSLEEFAEKKGVSIEISDVSVKKE